MICIDVDGVLINFYGTARKFGIELEPNVHGKWKWGEPPYPSPEEFYAKAELQPWAWRLTELFFREWDGKARLMTKDFAEIKESVFRRNFSPAKIIEAPDKTIHCKHPTDLLIDDCYSNCADWWEKGGKAYHFDLEDENPFENFLDWWRLG